MQKHDRDVTFRDCIRSFQGYVIVRHISDNAFVNTARNSLDAHCDASIPNQEILDMLIIHLGYSSLSRDACPDYWITVLFPGNKKQAVTIGVLQTNKPAAPSFIARAGNLKVARLQLFVERIHVADAQHEMNSSATLQHRFYLLNQGNTQRT